MSGHDALLHLRDGGGLLRNRVERVGRRPLPIALEKPPIGRPPPAAPSARSHSPAGPPRKSRRRSTAKRYFAGEETDFPASGSTSATRTRSSGKFMTQRDGSAGAKRQPMGHWRRTSAPVRRLRATSGRRWRKSSPADHPLPPGPGRGRQSGRLLRAGRSGDENPHA